MVDFQPIVWGRAPGRSRIKAPRTSRLNGARPSYQHIDRAEDSDPSLADSPPRRTPAHASEFHDGSSGTVKKIPLASRRQGP